METTRRCRLLSKKRNNDVVLVMTLKYPLGVSIGSILRTKMKWIQEEFNRLSQEAWVKRFKFASLDLRLLFGSYLRLHMDFRYDFNCFGN
jgi:hypothetical protein